MKIEVLDRQGAIIESNILNTPQEDGSPYFKHSYATSEKYWTSNVTEIMAGQSHVAIHRIDVKEQVSLKTSGAPSMVGMLFLEKGSMHVKQSDRSFREIGTLQHNLIYNPQSTEETLFYPNQQLWLTIVNFSPNYFFKLAEGGSAYIDRMASDIDRGNKHLFATQNNMHLSLPMLRLLNSLDSSIYNSASLRLSTEAKIMELLSMQIAQIDEHSKDSVLSKLNDGDIKRLNHARECIISDLSSTPTLESLAVEAGINVYKLKIGFKALFGQSVFSFLREERLALAYDEISKRNSSLTEIAYQTGFASISHFSDAFKNRYGFSPSQLR